MQTETTPLILSAWPRKMQRHGERSGEVAESGNEESLFFPTLTGFQLLGALISLLLGFSILVLSVVWFKVYHVGFNVTTLRFNLHPFLMIVAIGFLLTNGILSWRSLPFTYRKRKIIHATLNATAAGLIGLALWAIITSKNTPHFYSSHSWFGLATVFLLALQALGGISYILPHPPGRPVFPIRWHAWGGLTVYTMGVLTISSGFVNFARILQAGGQLPVHSPEMYLVNCIALIFYVLLLTMLFTLIPRKRVTRAEEKAAAGSSSGSTMTSERPIERKTLGQMTVPHY